MNVKELKSIKMSLMKTAGEINEETSKADYLVKGSAKFDITDDFYKELEKTEETDLTKGLISAMYEELLAKIEDVDTVGIWVEYGDNLFENAMKIDTLNVMKDYGVADNIIPIYEFFKLTIGAE
jgi:acetate kinase